MKRLLSLLLVFSMMLSLVPAMVFANSGSSNAAVANPFTDVKNSDWFYDAVQYARINGFFNGTTETTFAPNGTMTRGMFVTVLGRMAGVDTADYGEQTPFKDVPANAYYAPYVAWAAKHGITSGMSDGTFAPDSLINREQMATFFVRYFDNFGIDYSTGENITTTPADMNNVSDWAQDAVKSLWKQGLLNGDGTNFNPKDDATRAQTATIAQRTDNVVETWYREPGIPSERVKIDPKAELPADSEEVEKEDSTETKKKQPLYIGGSSARKYEVKFELGAGCEEITLPETATYSEGTPISSLPTPSKNGVIFLGWYYDEEMTNGVETGDTVNSNITLYAKVAAGSEVTSIETPNYITRTEVAEGAYSFEVIGVSDINSAIKFINITGGNATVDYSVSGTTVTATLDAGQTYQIELINNSARFKLSGEDIQPQSIRYLNILTAKETVTNAEISKSVKQISVETTSGLGEEVFEGLYKIDDSGVTAQNESNGTFTYNGDVIINSGDTIAITSGDVDLTDVTSTEGHVAYVNITAKNGNTYSYEMASLDDVLFVYDVLPIQSNWDNDNVDNQITVSTANLAASMSKVEAESLDVGDFLAFLEAGKSYETSDDVSSYGEITNLKLSGDNYIITYITATESDIEDSFDVYYTQDKAIELTEEEKNQIENGVVEDIQDSDYVEEAALYLASVMLESNNLEEVPDLDQVTLSMQNMKDSSVLYEEGSVTRAGSNGTTVKVKFDVKNVRASVTANKELKHLKGKGFGVSVKIPFIVTITGSDGNKLSISITAEFDEEVLLKQNISTKRHKIGFLKYDYSLNASFEVGNYTGIDFKASIHTADGDNAALGDKLEKIIKEMINKESGSAASDNEGIFGDLPKTYRSVMEKASDYWIDVVDVNLFDTNGSAFLHIFCWQVKGSFVVSANLSVVMGIKFDYTTQKKYNFSVRVKAQTASNEVIDIIEPQYNFDFYVVGTIGIRAGLRLEMYVGLISLKVDKVGITAEVGAYARLWGYFFYHLEWSKSEGKKTSSAGAMLIEIGIYLDINFVAKLFNSNKYTWSPTIYSKEWPLWSAGERMNIYGFNNTEDTAYSFITTKTLALPGSTYDMKYMDLKSGETGSISKDDSEEKSYIISFTNPAFTYSPENNTVTVAPTDGALELETDMSITWKPYALSFTSSPIQKIIHLVWSDPEGMRYISFDPMGGSAVGQLYGGTDAPITWPENPVRAGYTFNGWYTDNEYTTAYTGSTTVMPEFPEGTNGVTLYAKWEADDITYKVEHYLQELNGSYTLNSTQTKTGKTDSVTAERALGIYAGYTAKEIEQKSIAADGSTVVEIYYNRDVYTITFVLNNGSDEVITKTYLYGEAIAAPVLARDGYSFGGWDKIIPEEATSSETYTAKWIGNDNNVVFDSQGGSSVETAIVPTGDKVAKPADPTRTGYTFGGWYIDKLCTEAWSFNSDTIVGGITLYAKWIINKYNVTFDANGGNALIGNYTNGSVDYGTVITAPNTPSKDSYQGKNYTFTGWNTAKDGSGTTLKNGDTITDDVTYFAQWEIAFTKYTVKWIIGDTTAETDNDLIWGDTVIYNGATPSKTADVQYTYTFDSWNTKADGSGDKWKNGDTITGNATYYAQFTKTINKYTVNWDVNGGNALSGNYTTGSVDYGTAITLPNLPTKTSYQGTNYTFAGWNTAKDGSGTTLKDSDTVIGNVTYYAQWTISYTKYTVKWIVNDATVETDSDLMWGTAIAYNGTEPTKAADAQYTYTFDSWNTEADGSGNKWKNGDTISGNATYYAQFTKTVNQYNIEWNSNGGNELTGNYTKGSVNYGTTIIAPAVPTKTADVQYTYTFDSWNTKADGSGEKLNSGDTVKGDVVYYAQFTKTLNKYTVIWNVNGGNSLSGNYTNGSVDYGTKIIKPADPSKTATQQYSYTFKGWYTAPEGGTIVTEFGNVTGDVRYYAQWSSTVNKYTVEFNVDGGSEVSSQTVDYGSKIIEPNAPEKANHTFEGWYIDESFSRKWNFDSDAVTENITIYAKWKADIFTITWYGEGGTWDGEESIVQTVLYGDEIAPPADPSKESDANWHYNFAGWFAAPENTNEVKDFGTVTGDASYYAGWYSIKREYTVNFNSNGGSSVSSQYVGYNEKLQKPNNPTKTASSTVFYTFAGWYKDEELTLAWDFDNDIVTSEGITLYAKWEESAINYGLWIGDNQFTSQNLTINGTSGGSATYDPETTTLTLNNFKYTGASGRYENLLYYYHPGNGMPSIDTLTINVNGICSIENSGSGYGIYIGSNRVHLNITGDGDLTVYGGRSINTSYNCAIMVFDGTLSVDLDGILSAYGRYAMNSSRGIVCNNLYVDNGYVKAYGAGNDTHSNGMALICEESIGIDTGSIIVFYGKVYAEGGAAQTTSYGIKASSVEVSIGEVYAAANTKMYIGAYEMYNAFYGVETVSYGYGGYAKVSSDSGFNDTADWKSSDYNRSRYIKIYAPGYTD